MHSTVNKKEGLCGRCMINRVFKRNFKEHYMLITKKKGKRTKKTIEFAVTEEQFKAIKTLQEHLLIALYVSSGQIY